MGMLADSMKYKNNTSMKHRLGPLSAAVSMTATFLCVRTRQLSSGLFPTRIALWPATQRPPCFQRKRLASKVHECHTPSENTAPTSRRRLTGRIFELVGREFDIEKPAVLSKVLFEEFRITNPNTAFSQPRLSKDGCSERVTKSRSLSQASLAAVLKAETDPMKRELVTLVLDWLKAKAMIRRGGFKASGDKVTDRSDWSSHLIPDHDRLPTDPSEFPLLLIDGHNIIFRSFHALPPLKAPNGTPVGAVVGFCNVINRLVLQPWAEGRGAQVRVVVVFDTGEDSFRHIIYPEYKASRPQVPEDLRPQFALIREACDAYGLEVASYHGFEADDAIATLALKAVTSGTANVTIVSTDKDLAQLVTRRVKIFNCYTQETLGPEEVLDKYLAPPGRLADLLALAGDKADGIKGAEGYGPVKAAKVLAKHATLEEALDEICESFKAKKDPAAIEHLRSEVMKARSITGLRTDLPIEVKSKNPFHLGHGATGLAPLLKFMRDLGMDDLYRRICAINNKAM